MALISCTRATSPDNYIHDENDDDDGEKEFYLSDYITDTIRYREMNDILDNDSMIVNSPSLLELEDAIIKANKSKQVLLKRLLSRRRRRKVERRITLPTSTHLTDILKHFKRKSNGILLGTKSQFDINTIERRIELSELDRRNSIGNLLLFLLLFSYH